MIRIKVAAYALNDFLWACYCSNIKDITVTKEEAEIVNKALEINYESEE